MLFAAIIGKVLAAHDSINLKHFISNMVDTGLGFFKHRLGKIFSLLGLVLAVVVLVAF